MADVILTRSEALKVLAALDDGAAHALMTGVLALTMMLEDAIGILVDRLFPDLPQSGA